MHDPKCDRFHDDDEAAHELVTEHMRDLGERLLREDDFSYEDSTGQDEPPVVSPPAPGENSDRTPGPDGDSPVNTDTTRQEAEGDHDDKRRRIDEPGPPVSTVAQDEVSKLRSVPFDSDTRNDEIAVNVLPEEPAEMIGENGQGWITEEAFFTVSPGARQVRQRKEVNVNHSSPAE